VCASLWFDRRSEGDFSAPLATHGEQPPGVKTMREQKDAIAYRLEETPDGGRIRIQTSDHKARHAIHDFLRYQIQEHATSALTVER
jgi:hypothetical protein